MAAYWRSFKGIPVIYEDSELGVLHTRKSSAGTLLSKLRHQLPIFKHKLYLRRVLHHFKACTVVSKVEKEYLRRMVPEYRSIEIIPNCVDLKAYQQIRPKTENNTMVFSGSLRYFANHDAMMWFIEEILPRIQRKVPEASLLITGDPGNFKLPTSRNVKLTGWVENIKEVIASAAISIAPIRMGSGTRLKILEAMALRTPVVTTSIGVEGIDVVESKHVLIADTPETFADKVIHLLKNPGLHKRLSDNSYELVRLEYDWETVMPRFLDLIDQSVKD